MFTRSWCLALRGWFRFTEFSCIAPMNKQLYSKRHKPWTEPYWRMEKGSNERIKEVYLASKFPKADNWEPMSTYLAKIILWKMLCTALEGFLQSTRRATEAERWREEWNRQEVAWSEPINGFEDAPKTTTISRPHSTSVVFRTHGGPTPIVERPTLAGSVASSRWAHGKKRNMFIKYLSRVVCPLVAKGVWVIVDRSKNPYCQR